MTVEVLEVGLVDTEGKKYLYNNDIFADAFNYLVYGGKSVIKPDELKELDTTELAMPYGNGTKVPVQKYRDVLKIWSAKTDNDAIYVILGAEIQDKVHYGMPVKDGLYDMLGYSDQIDKIRRSYKKSSRKNESGGVIAADDGVLKIKLTSEEFLSGLRKDDKLIPIITAVVYLGGKPWDGPRSLHEMLDFKNEELKKYVPDYRINLISPADMEDAEFEKFSTDLGFAMNVIKYQRELADKVIERNGHRKIDRDTADFLNVVADLDFEYEEEAGGVDMCLAMEKKQERDKISGVIDFLKTEGVSEKEIVRRITKAFNVREEYVKELLNPQDIE